MIRNAILVALLALGMTGAASAQDIFLTDAQVGHIAYTVGKIDIAAAEQALAKSTNPAVLKFAEQIARDRKAVNNQATALVEKLGVTHENNAISQTLTDATNACFARPARSCAATARPRTSCRQATSGHSPTSIASEAMQLFPPR